MLAVVGDRLLVAVGLGLFAVGAALPTAALSTGFGAVMQSENRAPVVRGPRPALGTAGLGIWFLIGASAGAL
jgi:hypothetical protein